MAIALGKRETDEYKDNLHKVREGLGVVIRQKMSYCISKT